MPGIRPEHLRSVGNWFPSGLALNDGGQPAAPQIFNDYTTSTSFLLPEKQVLRSFRTMMNDMFIYSRMPNDLHRFNSMLTSNDLDFNLLGGTAPLVAQFNSNVEWLKSMYDIHYRGLTSMQQGVIFRAVWRAVKDSHLQRTVLSGGYVVADRTYYLEHQGGYNTLLTLFEMLHNWSATHMTMPQVYRSNGARSGGMQAPQVLLAPMLAWVVTKQQQDNTEEVPNFEYKLYPRAGYLRT